MSDRHTSPAASFRRIAIVNRGEPAMRLIHAVRDLRAADGTGPRTVALHTHAERAAMFVREADEAIRIGPGPGEPAGTNPYLDHDELVRALTDADADAAWVGWGFVAEDAAFADRCAKAGVTFVGPPGEVMRRLGDKIGAKHLAESAGVPVAPWSGGPVDTVEEARAHLERIGVPLVVKATAGGGGRGIRVVRDASQLDTAFERARAEAATAFGDPTVFLERMVTDARHVEVQVVADAHGGVWAAGVRDCSVQRRNQKVVEESASTALDADREAELKRAAADLVRAAGYVGAGTVEFLLQPATGELAFLEVNTRLQVEHTVTELTTDLDLVRLQLHVAAGGRLDGDPPAARGHAIEVRLNAEDPDRGFAPAAGRIELLTLPTGPGIRVDTGVAEGDVIPPEYDSMIAKLLAWGRDRDEALARLRRALDQTTVLIEGGTTNRAFLAELLRDEAVVAGEVDTGWLDRRGAARTGDGPAVADHAEVALVAAAVDAHADAEALDRQRFLAAAARGRPEADAATRRTVDLRHAGTPHRLEVARTGLDRYLVEADGARVLVRVERVGRYERRLTIAGARHRVVAIRQGADLLVEVDGAPHRLSQDDAGLVRAPGPSVVVALRVAPGDVVEAGAGVAVLESMKMETVLTAPFAGVVREVSASPNAQLDTGAPVVRLEEVTEDEPAPSASDVDLRVLAADGDLRRASTAEAVDALHRLVLGYDVPAEVVTELVEVLRAAPTSATTDGDDEHAASALQAELAVLRVFADIASLSRNRRFGDADDASEAHSAREYLHAFLRTLDVDAEDLPPSFQDKLRRALAHHDVASLERTPALEQALFRIHLAQQRAPAAVPAVVALLERRLRAGAPADLDLADELRDTLDRLVVATQVRHPLIGDLSRRTRYRCFDRPRLEARRDLVYAEVRDQLRTLATERDPAVRAERVRALIDAPDPLLPLLDDPSVVDGSLVTMLEVLTRRYYRTRDLGVVRHVDLDGHVAVVADFRDPRGDGRIVTLPATDADLDDGLRALGPVTDDLVDATAGVVLDVHLTWPDGPDDTDELATTLTRRLDDASLPGEVRRVTFSVPGASIGGVGTEHLTFRRTPDGFRERHHLRGIHPLIAARLGLWHFGRFAMTRLASSEGVYLFDATARDDATDRRLFVLAEVRDLTPTRDADGTLTGLPELERVLAACLDDLRQARAAMSTRDRPDWNRVQLTVSPVVDLPMSAMDTVVRAIAPTTDGLGLEQIVVNARLAVPDGDPVAVAVRLSRPPGQGVTLRVTEPARTPLASVDETTRRVVRARQRGTVYPYELVPLLTGGLDGTAAGRFVEHDLDPSGALVAVDRPHGGNQVGVVVGVVTTPTERYPEGMRRVVILGDPTKGLGSIAEGESRRVIGALDLAERLDAPVEWFAVSSGARIAMDSGTENMDWVARVLRRIIEFTQAGREIHVVVSGINVGAQPYWNAEATMLMHTKGILVMTPDSAMVLTGKQALDYSGGVSAEDNFGIGGHDRVMGPNGQAQHWAPDLASACQVLFRHHEHSYRAPGERFPRRAATADAADRDVRDHPHVVDGSPFTTVGEIFDEASNPGRKKPFDIRTLLHAVADADHPTLERWRGMADAEIAVSLDAHLGGWPVTLLGIESRPLARRGVVPADGPEQWTAGTLFPRASKKVARAVNAASGIRPLVVLANLSGFDGSPESLRQLQLEYGAEIGRAVTNFDGPIVFCVVSRYHGGAFVVFSKALNDGMEVAAVEGSHASVIGGPPAAAVVFARDVDRRTSKDPRVVAAREAVARADDVEVARCRAELDEVERTVRSDKLGEVAAEFDAIHSIQRAQQVGSVDHIVAPADLRPYLIDAVERGIARTQGP